MATVLATVTHLTRCHDDRSVIALHAAVHGWLCGTCQEVTTWLVLSDQREWICEGCMADLNWSTPVAV